MEDDLKILKVEYLSNHSLDPPQILNLSSRDQTRKLEETSEEISSVALLSPACFVIMTLSILNYRVKPKLYKN